MKKMLILLIMLTLWLSSSALADAAFDFNVAGPYDITLGDALLKGTNAPAINISDPGAKLTITLKTGTTCTLVGDDNFAGISVGDAELVIRCEKTGEGHTCNDTCGKMIVNGGLFAAGIGSNKNSAFTGTITIMGGQIIATGSDFAAGIGSGADGAFLGDVIITGGTVTASGGDSAAGIGSGFNGYVTECSMSGTIEITGGTVSATGGGGAAGIGSGYASDMDGTVKISGGTVTAAGNLGGTGIGSGSECEMSGTIEITGGNIAANGSAGGAGIGSGYIGKMSGSLTVTGGTVTATGGAGGAGIGSGYIGKMSGSLTVTGGTVTAIGSAGGAGIGSGLNGSMESDASIVISPASGMLEAKAGADKNSADHIDGSPYANHSVVTSLLENLSYVRIAPFIPTPTIAPSATPVPATPTPAPNVPETGDSTNFALLAVLAAVSMIGITVILRKRNEA